MQGSKSPLNSRKLAMREHFFFQNKPVSRMNEEICCVTNEGETTKNEWENDDSGFLQAL